MIRKTVGLLAFAFLAISTSLRAELTWEKTEVELHPAAGDATAVGVFKYQNKGDKAVHIASVHTSCGCTTAGVVKNDVAPNEKGEITATFNIGGRTGVQQKTITVTTDDVKQPVTQLTLKAIIAQGLEIQPSFVYWQQGEQPTAKKIIVKTTPEMGVKSLEVVSSSPDFTTKVESPTAAGDFNIAVTPHNTAKPSAGSLTITPVGGGGAKSYHVTVRVTNASEKSVSE